MFSKHDETTNTSRKTSDQRIRESSGFLHLCVFFKGWSPEGMQGEESGSAGRKSKVGMFGVAETADARDFSDGGKSDRETDREVR